MGIEKYEGNSASSVAILEGEIIAIKKRHFAICVTSCKPRNLTSTNGTQVNMKPYKMLCKL